MAMTLRLSDEEAAALRAQAEVEQRSMQDVAKAAVREYVERHAHKALVAQETTWAVSHYEELLDRLGKA